MSHQPATDMQATALARSIAAGEIDAEIVAPGVPTPTVPDAAIALGVSESQIVKSLLFADRDGRVVLALVSGSARVNRDRLAMSAGVGKLKLADPNVVLARTGYPAGGTPPVGHVERLTVIVDRGVMDHEVVFGGGGAHDLLLRVTPAEIVRCTAAKVDDIVD